MKETVTLISRPRIIGFSTVEGQIGCPETLVRNCCLCNNSAERNSCSSAYLCIECTQECDTHVCIVLFSSLVCSYNFIVS
jgi:hypothetical protein